MPTFRILNRTTNAVLVPSVQSDTDISAGLDYLASLPADSPLTSLLDLKIDQLSSSPPPNIFTVAFNLDEGQGGGVKEICATGSRQTAIREAGKDPKFYVIEEDRDVNRIKARERK